MEFAITKTVNKGFEEAIDALTAALKEEGFGVITEIDLSEKFREKLGIDFRNYKILGACNPALAHKAIEIEDRIGVMLPCNMLVQQKDEGVEVSAINPLNSIGVTGNEKLKAIAAEVSGKLEKIINSL